MEELNKQTTTNNNRVNFSLTPTTTISHDAKKVKRSVSETKKKYVAANQNWKCDNCNCTLTYTYEIDHKIRLEHGGSNDVDNLVALCRECHGQKTAMENM